VDFAWSIFDSVAGVVGTFGAVVVLGGIVAGAVYWLMGSR
jgi:hypothetical protein